jgi:ferredoxin
VTVACTQEQRLFAALADETEGARAGNTFPIKFINIRETGGWSADASKAMPKIAALLAAAQMAEPDPVPTVTYKSEGRLLIIGELAQATQIADMLSDTLSVTIFSIAGRAGSVPATSSFYPQERKYPVLAGSVGKLSGWLGAFKLDWQKNNPIDLDLCTRCNACVVACPEQAISVDFQINMGKCQSHRSCVSACDVAGAIDFEREPVAMQDAFDIVLDLSETPLKSPNSSSTSKSSAPIRATKKRAAMPASTCAQRMPSAATKPCRRSRSIPIFAWAAALVRRFAPRARSPMPTRKPATRA